MARAGPGHRVSLLVALPALVVQEVDHGGEDAGTTARDPEQIAEMADGLHGVEGHPS